ncbi:class I adenylate-forming enzyme family protein [Blastococcus sp. SYSU D00820]
MHLLIGNAVADAAVLRPRAAAATLGEESISFADLDAESNRVAHVLQGLGVRAGDVVAWWAGSTLRSLSGFVACARLGAVFAPVPPTLGAAEAAPVLAYLQPRLLVTDGPRRALADPADVALATVATGAGDDLHVRAGAAAATPVRPDRPLDERDPHVVFLTSGSTGRPKGVLVSHRATWLRSSPGAGTWAGTVHGDGGVLSSFPLFHYGGWHYVVEAWLHRTAVHLVDRADADSLHAAVARRRPSAMYCIPAVWERVLEAPGDLGCLRHADTGTSQISADFLGRLRERTPGATTTVLYGATEAGPMAALRHWQLDERPGSVGRPIGPGVLALAEDGEILARGPMLMNGYLDLPEQTGEVLRDGWYRTGDLGECDDDGFFTITGRKREVIRSAGETVAPAEVEAAIRALPGIADAAVVGLPDDRWGEVVCAVVVPEAGAPVPDVATLRAGLTGLAPFKHPRRVEVAGAIPRTSATGQVMRARVRADLLAATAR